MTVGVMLDRRRQTEHAHLDQPHQTLVSCLDALRKLHAGNEAQSVRLEEALNQLLAAVEKGTESAASKLSESSAARTKELLAEAQRTTNALEPLKASLEESVKF